MNDINPFQLAGNIRKGIEVNQQRNALDDILKEASQSQNPEQEGDLIRRILTQVAPDRRQDAMQFLQRQGQQRAAAQQSQAYEQAGLNPNLPESLNRELLRARGKEQGKTLESKEKIQDAFSRAEEILSSGATGISIGALTPQGRELRSELDTLGEVFISQLIPLLNPRGTISQSRFNYIKSLVPQSSDTDAKIKGKLAALKDIFKLEGEKNKMESEAKTREMKDASGNVYDIPAELYEKALAQGLK